MPTDDGYDAYLSYESARLGINPEAVHQMEVEAAEQIAALGITEEWLAEAAKRSKERYRDA